MFVWTEEDATFMKHVQEVMGDRMSYENGYTDEDRGSLAKLETLADPAARVVIVNKGTQPRDLATMQLQDIVRAEIRNWIPNASQRLIRRASVMLDLPCMPVPITEDHGPDRAEHALIPDWVGGLYLMRCVTCNRVFDV